MAELIFLTGPVRSGKSARAVALARRWGDDVVLVATYRDAGDDREMTARLARHRADRPGGWRTLEAPRDVPAALEALEPAPHGVVLDCATLWLADRFELDDASILSEWDALLAAARTAPWPMVIVGTEIGWSPVPEHFGARRFRDLAGWLGQRAAEEATEAWLLVAGRGVRLK
jgi:adenosylcobinamide kinase/adenosylcobinamide-phosphate guanylyltransferase